MTALSLNDALRSVPVAFRDALLSEFHEMQIAYRRSDWEKTGLKLGKICEIIFGIVDGLLAGHFAPNPYKPVNMLRDCSQLEQKHAAGPRPLRIQIPRLLIACYELRNNRAIGHVGGEINPNKMDADLFMAAAKWLIAELVRNTATLSLSEATALVNAISEREHPIIWNAGSSRRVLLDSMTVPDQILVLLYGERQPIPVRTMLGWIEYTNASRFRNTVLAKLHSERIIEYDRARDTIILTPKGIQAVEHRGLLEQTTETPKRGNLSRAVKGRTRRTTSRTARKT